MKRTKKTASAALYAAGAAAVAMLVSLAAAGTGQILFPDAMLPMELRELASAWLAIGFLPMLLACVLVYQSWNVKNSSCPRRNAALLFLPAVVCLLAMLVWVGVWTAGMLRALS